MAASIFVTFSKDFFFAGEPVHGNVLLTVGAPTQVNAVKLKVSGFEVCKFYQLNWLPKPPDPYRAEGQPYVPPPPIQSPPEQTFNGQFPPMSEIDDGDETGNFSGAAKPMYLRRGDYQVAKIRWCRQKFDIIRSDGVIGLVGGVMMPGQYQYPFSFLTDPSWPASFNFSNHEMKARIGYDVIGYLDSPVAQVYNTGSLVMRQTAAVEAKMVESRASVSCCCCFPQGEYHVKVAFEKNGYTLGETAKMYAEIDNRECSQDIEKIHVSITNHVHVRVSEGLQQNAHNKLVEQTYPGLAAGESLLAEKAPMYTVTLGMNPAEYQPTCTGKLVRSTFQLQLHADVDPCCGCCSDQAIVSQQITIFPKIYPIIYPPAFQQNWSPQMMPAYSVPVQPQPYVVIVNQ